MTELPRLLVIGAAKAGTTSLARWLDDHSEVSVAPMKEVNFFSYDSVWARGVDWYGQQFAGLPGPVLCDTSPSYLPAPDAPRRIRSVLPDARLLVLLRDPVERTFAHYRWLRSWGVEQRSFRAIVEAETADGPTPFGCVDGSRYAAHLERYLTELPADRLLLLDFSELRDEPATLFRKVCAFAGLRSETPESVGIAFNEARRVWSGWAWRQLGRSRRRSWREQPRGVDRLLAPRARPARIDPTARRLLEDYYAPYDERLRALWKVRRLPWEDPTAHQPRGSAST